MESKTRELVAAYRAMEPPPTVITIAREMGGGFLSEDVQRIFAENCLHDKICNQYPPKSSYVKQTLKQFILAAEADNVEVVSCLYEQALLLIYSKEEQQLQRDHAYRTYTLDIKGETVSLKVSDNMLEGNTGCYCWPAGLLLAEFVLTHSQLFSGECCVELGSGTGLVGICLARCSAAKVILTDGDSSTVTNLECNLAINGCHEVVCRQLMWEYASDKDFSMLSCDIILGADLIYDPECVPHLVKALRGLLSSKSLMVDTCISGWRKPDSPVAYLATVKRNPETLGLFLDSICESGLQAIDVTVKMRPLQWLQGLRSFDRSSIVLHQIVLKK